MEMFLAPPNYGAYILQLIRFARVCSNVSDFNNRNQFLTAELLKQRYQCHKIRKAFSKFYHRHSVVVSIILPIYTSKRAIIKSLLGTLTTDLSTK